MDGTTLANRTKFADFLDRLSLGRSSDHDWQRYIVAHYPDSFLEEMRRCVVRLFHDQLPVHSRTDAANEVLKSWAMAVRATAVGSNYSHEPTVNISVTYNEAVVLDEFLRRYSNTDTLKTEHLAEQQVALERPVCT